MEKGKKIFYSQTWVDLLGGGIGGMRMRNKENKL